MNTNTIIGRWILAAALIVAGTGQMSAQKETPPTGGKPKDFKLAKKQTVSLRNGLTIVMVPYGTIPKVSVSVVVRFGNINENEKQVWLADMVGDLMKEGTGTRSAKKVAEEAAGMGGTVNIGVGEDQSNFGGDVLTEFGPNFVALLGDVVRNPLFPESELARLKNDRVRQITVARSQPGSLTQEQFRRLLYGDHPYGRLFPTEEMIRSYAVEDIRKFYGENVGAQRTTVYVSGKFDAKAMEAAVRKAFDSWEKGPAVYTNPPNPKAKKAFTLVERPGAAQSTINLGLPTINPVDPDYIPLSVTNTLLGGYFSSRVTANIREAKGYTYSPFSQISTRYHDAYYAQIADVTTDVTGPSLKEIFHEIDSLRASPPTEAELDAVKNYLSGSFVLQNSTRGGIIGQLSFLKLQGLPDSYLTNYVKNVNAVTTRQVQEMATKYIRPDDMTLVITGDKEKINKQIEEYAKPTVEGK